MTIKEAAQKLYLSPQGVWWRIYKGYLKATKVKFGKGGWRYDISAEEIQRVAV